MRPFGCERNCGASFQSRSTQRSRQRVDGENRDDDPQCEKDDDDGNVDDDDDAIKGESLECEHGRTDRVDGVDDRQRRRTAGIVIDIKIVGNNEQRKREGEQAPSTTGDGRKKISTASKDDGSETADYGDGQEAIASLKVSQDGTTGKPSLNVSFARKATSPLSRRTSATTPPARRSRRSTQRRARQRLFRLRKRGRKRRRRPTEAAKALVERSLRQEEKASRRARRQRQRQAKRKGASTLKNVTIDNELVFSPLCFEYPNFPRLCCNCLASENNENCFLDSSRHECISRSECQQCNPSIDTHAEGNDERNTRIPSSSSSSKDDTDDDGEEEEEEGTTRKSGPIPPPPPTSSHIVNEDNVPLSKDEESLLSKGLKFIPTPHRWNKTRLCLEFQTYASKMRRAYTIATRKRSERQKQWQEGLPTRHPIVHKIARQETAKSDSRERGSLPAEKTAPHPQQGSWNAARISLETFIREVDQSLRQIEPKGKTASNLSGSERQALKKLAKRTDIIIKQADKGSGIVVQSKEKYVEHGEAHVSDERTYVPLQRDPTVALTKEINETLNDFHRLGLLDNEEYRALYRSDESTRTQVLYFLRKIHKNPYGIRPIVSGCAGPTEGISSYVDAILQPIVERTESFLKDSTSFVREIEQTPAPHNALLVTIDVSALYTSIPQEKGIRMCSEAVRTFYPDVPELANVVATFLQLILQENVFTFNGKPYKQKHGTAMGTKCAPCFANLYMNELEKKFLDSRPPHLRPSMWKQYIDDIWCVWPHSRNELETFLR